MTSTVSIKHSFEAGHRLPVLPGKCQSLHGHSWTVEVVISADGPNELGIVANFTDLKKKLRYFIDEMLDHGLMLGRDDELASFLGTHGKVFVFGEGYAHTEDLAWPTVENVAILLSRVATGYLAEIEHVDGAYVAQVVVSETSTNRATWEAPIPMGEIISVCAVTLDAKLRVTSIEYAEEAQS